jgi:phosphoglucosamine mutase
LAGCTQIARSIVLSEALGQISRVFIGKDTRASGGMLENGLIEGFSSFNIEVICGGVLPTPAVSFLTRDLGFDCGISITASHNLCRDNGVKIFTREGKKLSDEHIVKINACLEYAPTNNDYEQSSKKIEPAVEIYYQVYKKALLSELGGDFSLNGMYIALDCANGANFEIAPRLFKDLGAKIIVAGCSPDGKNINASFGATCPQTLIDLVLLNKADVGISFDGDGDRLIMCDETGRIIDGDAIVATLALNMLKDGTLNGRNVVLTTMSNLGAEVFLSERGIKVYRSDVGDRSVAQMMANKKSALGGEQSGHIIVGSQTPTGDGILSALHMLKIIKKASVASKACHLFNPYPQLLQNICADRSLLNEQHIKLELAKLVDQAESIGCRLLVRPSGTEPLIRLMVEGRNTNSVKRIMADVSNLLAG